MSTFANLIDSDKPVLVDFFATWCGPCQVLMPILKELKDELGEKITVLKIDVDKNQELATRYQVKGVPTLMLFQKGKLLWRQSGVLAKNELLQIISTNQF